MTRFEEVYELATLIMEDEKIKQAPLYEKYLILYKFLQLAIGHFNTRCFKDLKTIQPYDYKEYKFEGDGVESEFVLGEGSLTSDTEIYVELETSLGSGMFSQVDPSRYLLDKVTSTVTFKNPINANFRGKIVLYRIGFFYDNLDFEEKSILAREMVVPFIERQLQKESLMNQMVYGTGAKMYAQSEHMKQLNTILRDTKYEIEGLINAYTYESDPDLTLNKRDVQQELVKDYEVFK